MAARWLSFPRLARGLWMLSAAAMLSASCVPSRADRWPEARLHDPTIRLPKTPLASPPRPVPPPPDSLVLASLAAAAPPGAPKPGETPIQKLLASIAPGTTGESMLLLGLHTEGVESYEPLYDEGKPVVNAKPGYRTVVVHTTGAYVELEPLLPYLAIPEPHGFVFASEASVAIDQTTSEMSAKKVGYRAGAASDDPDASPEGEMPKWYSATEVVTTRFRAPMTAVERARQEQLRAHKKWGTTRSQSILFATPGAICRFDSDAAWTGGALAFEGSTSQGLMATLKPVDEALSHYIDDVRLKKFATEVLARGGPSSEAHTDAEPDAADDTDLSAPVDVGFGRSVDFKKDAHACFERVNGKTMLSGAVVLSGNSARSFSADASVSELPESFGSNPGNTIDLAQVRAVFPEAKDAALSPSRSMLVVLDKDTVRIFEVRSRKETSVYVGAEASLVMIEWSEGETASKWAAELK